jgi:hypothetical protein
MVTVAVAVQLLASVTVKVYVPAALLYVPVPLYGGVPPDAVTVTVDMLFAHVMGVAEAAALSCGGSVTVTLVVAVQPLASVIVNECVPAAFWKVPVPL